MLLLISDRTELRRTLSLSLAERGIFFFDIPLEVASFYCRQKDTGGVILDCVPNEKAAAALFASLKAEYPELPIAILLAEGQIAAFPADAILRGADAEVLLCGAVTFYKGLCHGDDLRFSTYLLTVSEDPAGTLYFGYPLLLSPTEHRILRCLFYRAPRITSADDLMTLCYHSGSQGIANLSTQIRRINGKAAKIHPRPLICNRYGKGYLLSPEILGEE